MRLNISTGTLFSAFYKPRLIKIGFTTLSVAEQVCLSSLYVNKYLDAQSQKLSIGMRFEGEEVPERRFSGTIVGVRESTPSRGPDSEWRSLKLSEIRKIDRGF